MAKFQVKGRATFENVWFEIDAKDFQAAQKKAAIGQCEGYDLSCAEIVDFEMSVSTLEEND